MSTAMMLLLLSGTHPDSYAQPVRHRQQITAATLPAERDTAFREQ